MSQVLQPMSDGDSRQTNTRYFSAVPLRVPSDSQHAVCMARTILSVLAVRVVPAGSWVHSSAAAGYGRYFGFVSERYRLPNQARSRPQSARRHGHGLGFLFPIGPVRVAPHRCRRLRRHDPLQKTVPANEARKPTAVYWTSSSIRTYFTQFGRQVVTLIGTSVGLRHMRSLRRQMSPAQPGMNAREHREYQRTHAEGLVQEALCSWAGQERTGQRDERPHFWLHSRRRVLEWSKIQSDVAYSGVMVPISEQFGCIRSQPDFTLPVPCTWRRQRTVCVCIGHGTSRRRAARSQ